MRKSSACTLLILLALITAQLAACGSGAQPSSETTEADTPVTTSDPTKDELPERDFGGYEFRIVCRNSGMFHGRWLTDEENGDLLNDAIYKRNQRVAERFNIKFTETAEKNTDNARATVLAGEDAYDIINARCVHAWNYAMEGLLYSMNDLPYIDLTKDYWDDAVNDMLTVCNERYFAVGASNLTGYDFLHVLMFNKDMIEDYKLANPYELVKSGKWTLDKFAQMIEDISADVDGNGTMDKADQYGFLSQPKAILPGFTIGSGAFSIKKNANDEPYLAAKEEKFIDVVERSFAMCWDTGAWMPNTLNGNTDSTFITMFEENRALFLDNTFFYIESLRDMDADFGIIPYPKYDEQQTEYYSRMEGCELTCVPVTAADPERTSIILEALASESLESVIPAYYDKALKTKYSRDEESAEMLDIIFDNSVFDFGDTIWCDNLRVHVLANTFGANNRNIMSELAKYEPALDEIIKKSIEVFSALK
ncbi:MAG: hypothetical protein IJF67_06440 [Clostridia bacterium]|nr:hypothetical protein [Clostridia bacterium]